MGYLSKSLGVSLLSVVLVAAPNMARAQSSQQTEQQNQTQEIKVNANYGENEKSVYFGYWERNPRLRFGYVDENKFGISLYVPLSSNNVRLTASKNNGQEEFGLYHEHQYKKGKILFGTAVEYLSGTSNIEVHGIVELSQSNNIFAGAANRTGIKIATIGDFLDIGKYHLGLFASVKSGGVPASFGGVREVLLSLGYENYAKFFYRDDGNFRSFNGFVRFGRGEKRRYTPAAFYNDRHNFGEFTLRFAGEEKADIPLQPQNMHLSDQGTLAIAPSFLRTLKTNHQGVEGYYTHNGKWIGGYGFSRTENKPNTIYENTISAGANIGPIKIVGSWNTRKTLSVHASIRHTIKK